MTQSHTSPLEYRPEIDGLRALAVVPVILFHAGLKAFAGGFVGVDIFFVISGYLITLILVADQQRGGISLSHFYERRARRILPALLGVTLVASLLALLLMVPYQVEHFGWSVLALAGFASNFYFWKSTGYFAPDAGTLPLLHTWSLAVEEQFYLLFPLLLVALLRHGRQVAFLGFLGLAVASLLLGDWMVAWSAKAAYFLLPTRAWELLLGVLLAFLQGSRPVTGEGVARSLLAALGAALVSVSIVAFNEHTPFPGLPALIPTLGAALLIRYAGSGNLAGRLLGSRPLVAIGLVSYSAYLIHQPLLAFARLMRGADLPLPVTLGLVALVFPLSYLSWRFVEGPGRTRQLPRREVLKSAGASLALTASAGCMLALLGPLAGRQGIPDSVWQSINVPNAECQDTTRALTGERLLCPVNLAADKHLDFLYLGDSHMQALAPAVIAWAEARGLSGAYTGLPGCPPLLGVYVEDFEGARDECHDRNARVLEIVRAQRVRQVVLAARWSVYTGGDGSDDLKHLRLDRKAADSVAASDLAFVTGLRQTLSAYRDLGVKVYVILQVPQQDKEPLAIYEAVRGLAPEAMRRALRQESETREAHAALQARNVAILRQMQAEFPDTVVRLLDPALTFCDAVACPVGDETVSWYHDRNHLSKAGADRMLPQLQRELARIAPARAPASVPSQVTAAR